MAQTTRKSKSYRLEPIDGRKSFYGKARVTEGPDGFAVLTSYNTDVAMIDPSGHFWRLWDGYSATTMRHVNAFVDAFGIAGGGKKWWDAQRIAVVNAWGHVVDYDTAVAMMDDYIRETLHAAGNYDTPQRFFDAYATAHECSTGEEWELAKENPCY